MSSPGRQMSRRLHAGCAPDQNAGGEAPMTACADGIDQTGIRAEGGAL
jgi:hypothetical protein